MIETTIEVTGMVCGMCESHVNDAIRARFHVRSVRSSRGKRRTVILSDAPLSETALRAAITSAGYGAGAISVRVQPRRGLLSWLRRG